MTRTEALALCLRVVGHLCVCLQGGMWCICVSVLCDTGGMGICVTVLCDTFYHGREAWVSVYLCPVARRYRHLCASVLCDTGGMCICVSVFMDVWVSVCLCRVTHFITGGMCICVSVLCDTGGMGICVHLSSRSYVHMFVCVQGDMCICATMEACASV